MREGKTRANILSVSCRQASEDSWWSVSLLKVTQPTSPSRSCRDGSYSKVAARSAKRLRMARATTCSWSWRRDSNPRPSDYKSDALPAELRQHEPLPPAEPSKQLSTTARGVQGSTPCPRRHVSKLTVQEVGADSNPQPNCTENRSKPPLGRAMEQSSRNTVKQVGSNGC
jgi:hypothetical protein